MKPVIQSGPMTEAAPVTALLKAWGAGDEAALAALLPHVETELRRLARVYMARERLGHTLQTTALVNEAYLRLVDARNVAWQDRAHFYALAARQMRRILVDYAKARTALKRGGDAPVNALDPLALPESGDRTEITDIDDALKRLAQFDARKSEILELYYFGGLTYEELSEATQLSTTTLNLELRLAKAWLKDALA